MSQCWSESGGNVCLDLLQPLAHSNPDAVLEADYSVCLQLLLKYPPPDEAHGPHTFVDDAVYLRSHLNASGGATLIMKYTGKMPVISKSPEGSRPTTPSFRSFNAFRQRGLGTRSPPAFLNQQGGVEALFQGAAKGARGMLERGEKLGINQAVRDAMGEIRRNMQGFNESRIAPRSPRQVLSDEGAATALAAMEQRNQQLATMLEETVTSLRDVSASNLDDKAKSLELIEIAAAKIQFVKIYLEDSTMEVPVMVSRDVPMETDEKASTADSVEESKTEVVDDVKISDLNLDDDQPAKQKGQAPSQPESMDTSDASVVADPLKAGLGTIPERPAAVPTRSTLAQSSFSWMLEPNEHSAAQSRVASRSPPSGAHKKRPSNNASRERNAFLFGEVTAETEGRDPLRNDEIFGMEPLRKTK